VVGDDARSIYGFRAADVRNVLDFPKQFTPPAAIVTLDRNYRSTVPILNAANAVTRFMPANICGHFTRVTWPNAGEMRGTTTTRMTPVNIGERLRGMWSKVN
jgi:superfamily I DNA/RNA helicase